MSENLRRALFDAGLSEQDVAAELGVVPKTVRRWLNGRLPHARYRWSLAYVLGQREDDLWPDLRAVRAAGSTPDDYVATYPHRSSITRDGWRTFFQSAEHEIDILTYSGLFLAEDTPLLDLLADKARAGTTVRIALADPDGPPVAEHGAILGVDDANAAKIRAALVLYRPLVKIDGIELRLHRAVLYTSIYRADEDLLTNQHIYGIPAAKAPVFHLRRTADGGMATDHLTSFERIWTEAPPAS